MNLSQLTNDQLECLVIGYCLVNETNDLKIKTIYFKNPNNIKIVDSIKKVSTVNPESVINCISEPTYKTNDPAKAINNRAYIKDILSKTSSELTEKDILNVLKEIRKRYLIEQIEIAAQKNQVILKDILSNR